VADVHEHARQEHAISLSRDTLGGEMLAARMRFHHDPAHASRPSPEALRGFDRRIRQLGVRPAHGAAESSVHTQELQQRPQTLTPVSRRGSGDDGAFRARHGQFLDADRVYRRRRPMASNGAVDHKMSLQWR
jgi:diadenosine tetraphosphatase ApaH/serine/threonine PP2A family protein phosphatase